MALALLNTPHQLSPSDIQTDGGTQSRTNLNPETVEEYAAAMQAGSEFPPIVVYFDGDKYWLADGFHRLAAWKLTFSDVYSQPIHADVRQGTRRDAILHSVGANSAHGLRRTNADKRRAVLCLLEDGEWGAWSDREIARRCNVGGDLVGALRKSFTAVSDSERTYTTKHGTTATMQTANIGARPAPAPIPDDVSDKTTVEAEWEARNPPPKKTAMPTEPRGQVFATSEPKPYSPHAILPSGHSPTWNGARVEVKAEEDEDTQPPAAAAVKTDTDRHRQIIQTAVEDCQRILSRPAYLDAIKHASRDTQREHDLQLSGFKQILYLIAKK